MRRICVYCGSSTGASEGYADAARAIGSALCDRGLGLVYGGGNIGLMGIVADAVLHRGGEVIGVIPEQLAARELAHAGTDLRVVPTMHERKTLMFELADGFIALPGGLGTMEELFEMLTWAQLGMHRKPCGVLDALGYWQPLLALVDQAVAAGFVKPACRGLLLADETPEGLLEQFERYEPPPC